MEQFKYELERKFGTKRIRVGIIHDNRDLCINSYEREILQAIQKQQEQKHNLYWTFSENMFSKALTIPLTNHPNPQMDGLTELYKSFFEERIQLIINKWDKVFVDDKNLEYTNVKMLYKTLINEKSVDFDKYKEIRNMFEKIRNQH